MKFSKFYSLAESLASLPLKPEKYDPKDPQSVVRRNLASRDDAPRQQTARVLDVRMDHLASCLRT